MRLTAGWEATVVRGLRWKARRFARAEYEARDRGLERRAVLSEKAVVTFHPALSRLQDAEALVLVDGARRDRRLLADYALTNNLGVDSLPHRVVNQPTPRQQLGGHFSDVLDPHEIGEHVMALGRLRMIAQVDGSYRNANSFRLPVEEAAGGHDCKLVVEPDGAPRLEKKRTPRWLSQRGVTILREKLTQ